jgi:uncharacterized protein (DUF1810 family)
MTGNAEDPYELSRFVTAQNPVYERVCAELKAGDKRSHWMWFVFPQIAGLGTSFRAQHYAISGIDEARAYLAHPVLGARLRECIALVLAVEGRDIRQIFGDIDAQKFRSSMTLFAATAEDAGIFEDALAKFFGNARDELTLRILGLQGK